MREILFRGKRTDNGEWIVSDCIMQFEEHPIERCRVVQMWVDFEGWVSVDPSTVCQFTGQTDENGTKIFEGDIIAYSDSKVKKPCSVVRFGKHQIDCCGCCYDSHQSVGFYLEDIQYPKEAPWANETEWERLLVVGNIHDNPELLKGGE